MQKFSSHVVEKCLAVFNDENRSRVIHELICAPHFEQLLQDPHANYVVQSALRHSEVCNMSVYIPIAASGILKCMKFPQSCLSFFGALSMNILIPLIYLLSISFLTFALYF